MSITIDHVIIAVPDLDEAIRLYREAGFTTHYGGEHASGTTHNALIVFRDGTYLELLALTGRPANPNNPAADYSYYVRGRQGMVGFAFKTDDLPQLVDHLRQRGFKVNDIVSGSRLRTDGVRLEWQMAQLTEYESPFFITDVTDRNLRVPDDEDLLTHANGYSGIRELTFSAHEPESVVSFYRDLLAMESQKSDGLIQFVLGNVTLTIAPVGENGKEETTLTYHKDTPQ